MQLDAIGSVLDRYGVPAHRCPPVVVVLVMTGLSQVLVLEKALGITSGHDETLAFVKRYLRELEGSSISRDTLSTASVPDV